MLMPMSMTSNNSHQIALSSLHRRIAGEQQIGISHSHASPPPMHAIQSLAAIRDRPQSTITQSNSMAFMSAMPQDHYFVYQPVYSNPGSISMAPLAPLAPSSSSSSSLNVENTREEEIKAKTRLARKAELARESRKRKKESANDKQAHYEFLQRENEELKKELAEARAELKKVLGGDGAPPCENAPDLGLLKRHATPSLNEFSPLSSPMSQASALPQIPSPLDLTKATSEGVNPFAALREAAANNPIGASSIQFNGKQSAFSLVKPSSLRFSFRYVPVSAPATVIEDADCEVIETNIKKQKC